MSATTATKPRTTAPVSVRAAAMLAKAPKTTADEYANNDFTGRFGTLMMRCAMAFSGQNSMVAKCNVGLGKFPPQADDGVDARDARQLHDSSTGPQGLQSR